MKIKGFQDTINWYGQNAEQYASAIGNRARLDLIEKFVKLLPKRATVLDVGCAAGRDTKMLSDKGIKAIGIDLCKELLEIARKNFSELEFIEGNFLEIPFSDNNFDGIWAQASLLHLESTDEVKKALKELKRVLKDNAILYIGVKAKTGNKKFAVIKDKLSKHDRFFQFFTKDELKDLLTKSGFEIIDISQYKEIEKVKDGRPEVEWISCFAKNNKL